MLCDGTFISKTDYPVLFDLIGYTFGSFSGYDDIFALPNATDKILGISGNRYAIGDNYGSEDQVLSENNMPAHEHYIAVSTAGGSGYGYGSSYPYLAFDYNFQNDDNYRFSFFSSSYTSKVGLTGTVGGGQAFSIMQPTLFIGKMFIYAGWMWQT